MKRKIKRTEGGALVNGYSLGCAPKQFSSKTNDLRGFPNELRTIAGRRTRSGLWCLLRRVARPQEAHSLLFDPSRNQSA